MGQSTSVLPDKILIKRYWIDLSKKKGSKCRDYVEALNNEHQYYTASIISGVPTYNAYINVVYIDG